MTLSTRLRTGLAGFLVLSSSACFEMEQDLVVRANGKAKIRQSLRFTEGFTRIVGLLDEMSSDKAPLLTELKQKLDPFDDADRAVLKKHKVKLVRNDTGTDAAGLPVIDIEARVRNIADLDFLTLATGDAEKAENRRVRLERLDDGNVRLVMQPPDTPGQGSGGAPPTTPDMPDADPERMGELMGEMMGEMMAEAQNLKVVQRVTVPGNIVSVTPDVAVDIDGGTATWSFSAMDMMTAGASLSEADGKFQVVFTPQGKLDSSLFE